MTRNSNQPDNFDTQTLEIIGQHVLVDQLLRAGLEVATPLRDRGVDLIAYADLARDVDCYVARPIQMKAATRRVFSLDRKYERIHGLLLAYVWHVNDADQTVTYAMTYPEAFAIAEALGWTKTASWAKGKYANTRPGKKVVSLLEPYKMSSDAWRRRVLRGD